MNTTNTTWFLKGGKAFRPAPFGIMGIVNVTPDSFFDGGHHADCASAVAHAHRLLEQGAHILDLGAESSRPSAQPLTAKEEQHRLMPVLTQVRAAHPEALLSVDTFHASTAAMALEAGAHIINDISACRVEPALLDVVAHYQPGYVLMHSQGTPQTMQRAPQYTHVVDEVLQFFEEGIQRLTKAGLPENRIVLDPGIGFGKNVQHNVELLKNIARCTTLGRPVLMGISMKSFLGDMVGLPLAQRETATQVVTALLGRAGIAYHRVHHVEATAHTLALVQALQPPSEYIFTARNMPCSV